MTENSRSAGNVIDRVIAEALARPGAREVTTVDVRVGPFWTVVRTSKRAGIASTMAHDGPPDGHPIAAAGALERVPPIELAQLLRSTSRPEAAVGLATVNALLDPVAAGAEEGNAVDLLCERAAGRLLALVGHFPFTERLRESCRELWVFEVAGRRRPGDLEAVSMAELLPHAEVVAVTGTAVVNHTVEKIARWIRPDAFAVMLGPSTPMATSLFAVGFDALCGTVVEDPDAVVLAASQGAVTGQIAGVRRVCLHAGGVRAQPA
jgi:uncharacterized protein (DUF4213/DUF364 family)